MCFSLMATGCGKTTKVPQFILDEYREKGLFCNIVVAQPRRIAASSNAKRVCKERGWPCGSLVGYQVKLACISLFILCQFDSYLHGILLFIGRF